MNKFAKTPEQIVREVERKTSTIKPVNLINVKPKFNATPSELVNKVIYKDFRKTPEQLVNDILDSQFGDTDSSIINKTPIRYIKDADPANKLTQMTFIERIPVKDAAKVKQYIYSNLDSGEFKYPQSTASFIEDIMKLPVKCNNFINKTTYTNFHETMYKMEVPGRIKCSKNSTFVLQRKIRNSLVNNNYIDIDMVNAHLNILFNILKIYLPNYDHDNKYKYLNYLIFKRNDLIEMMKYLFSHTHEPLSKLDCKNFIFGSMYNFQRIDYIYDDTNPIVNELKNRTKINTYSYPFVRWIINSENDILLNGENINNNDYNAKLREFILLINNISYCIKNVQEFITELHEFGVPETMINRPYSAVKEFKNDSHSYLSSKRHNETLVVPTVIPTNTVSNIYFYLYNTPLRQQLKAICFNGISSDDNVYYNTEDLEECYKSYNVVFRLIMNEYEKTILYHCINYTMKKLKINNNLSAILCHDGYMLDRRYFEQGTFKYNKYLCKIKKYVKKQTGFDINFEYKGHCDEVIPSIRNYCVDLPVNNYECKYPYEKYGMKAIVRTKKEIEDLTRGYQKEVDPEYKLYYDSYSYYHKNSNKPQPIYKEKIPYVKFNEVNNYDVDKIK